MKINNGEIDCTPDNTFVLRYPNDILNGVIIDLDDNYAFISDHTAGTDQLELDLENEGIETIEIEEGVDLTDAPHAWVVQSVIRLVIREAEIVCEEAAE